MPRAYRCWLTPLALSLAVALAALTAAVAGLLANRCATCDLRLTPTGTDRTLVVSTVALVLGAVVITAVGGALQLLAVRPARPAFLVRSAALQTALAALGPVVLPAAILTVVTVATKYGTGWLAARRARVGDRGRVRAGLALTARGEFSIVIAGIGVAAGVQSDLGPLTACYVLMVAVVGSLLLRYSDSLAERFV